MTAPGRIVGGVAEGCEAMRVSEGAAFCAGSLLCGLSSPLTNVESDSVVNSSVTVADTPVGFSASHLSFVSAIFRVLAVCVQLFRYRVSICD